MKIAVTASVGASDMRFTSFWANFAQNVVYLYLQFNSNHAHTQSWGHLGNYIGNIIFKSPMVSHVVTLKKRTFYKYKLLLYIDYFTGRMRSLYSI